MYKKKYANFIVNQKKIIHHLSQSMPHRGRDSRCWKESSSPLRSPHKSSRETSLGASRRSAGRWTPTRPSLLMAKRTTRTMRPRLEKALRLLACRVCPCSSSPCFAHSEARWTRGSSPTRALSCDSGEIYICKSVENDLRHGNYICKSEEIYLTSSSILTSETEIRFMSCASMTAAVSRH